jgi:hypothetical protein
VSAVQARAVETGVGNKSFFASFFSKKEVLAFCFAVRAFARWYLKGPIS